MTLQHVLYLYDFLRPLVLFLLQYIQSCDHLKYFIIQSICPHILGKATHQKLNGSTITCPSTFSHSMAAHIYYFTLHNDASSTYLVIIILLNLDEPAAIWPVDEFLLEEDSLHVLIHLGKQTPRGAAACQGETTILSSWRRRGWCVQVLVVDWLMDSICPSLSQVRCVGADASVV